VRSGISLFDDKYAFLEPKNVYVVCGGVSAGKSALADQIADYVARQGENVYICCLEMSAEQRAQRFVSRRAKISLRAWQAQEYLSMEAERRLRLGAEEFNEPPIYIDDDRGITTMDIMARAKRFKDRHGLGLLVIDYLQLIRPMRRGPREQEVSEISGAINDMAGELNVPVISVCQLSRTHQHEGREPELRDLRESGRLEQDAFGVIAVYRPDLEQSACKMLVLKNRQGPLGRKEMRFIGEQVRFEDLTGGEEYGY
jgi:replicative DNA helicase